MTQIGRREFLKSAMVAGMSAAAPQLVPETATVEELQAVWLSRNFRAYVPRAWAQTQPMVPFIHNWHHDAIADHLEAVSLDQIRFLAVSVAPRHTKSGITCVCWPTWHWTRWPATQFVFGAYGMELATRDAVYSRRLMDSPWWRARWACMCPAGPHRPNCNGFRWTSDQNVKTLYENDRGGRRLTAAVESGTTGQGGDILVLDDAIDIQKANSEAVRKAARQYVSQVFLGRMNDPQRSKVVAIAQRTHTDDVTNFLVNESGLPFVHLKLPTEYRKGAMVGPTPIGFEDPRTQEGELLWKERFTPAVIAAAKVTLGPFGYAAQHQQDPSPEEGGIIKRENWRFWRPANLELPEIVSREGIRYPPAVALPAFVIQADGGQDELLLSLDCSFKDEAGQIRKGKEPDPVSIGAWGRHGPDCFLLDRTNKRLDIVGTITETQLMMVRFPKAVRKLIEDRANGPAVIAILRRRVAGIEPVTPTVSKVARVMTAAPTEKDRDARAMSMVAIQASHHVFLPHPVIAPWVWDYIEEHAAFPNAPHDDDVDMTSQALSKLQPWIWREADAAQDELALYSNLPPVADTRELLRRRVHQASKLPDRNASPVKPFVDPYRKR